MPKHDELTASTIQSKFELSDQLFRYEFQPLPFAFPAVCHGQRGGRHQAQVSGRGDQSALLCPLYEVQHGAGAVD